MSFEFMNIKHFESFTTLKGQNIDVEQEWCKKVLSPPQNILIPKECVVDVVNEIGHADKDNENLEPSFEMTRYFLDEPIYRSRSKNSLIVATLSL